MLPRRRPDNAAQDLYDDDFDADAAFASKPPLAKTSSISKVQLPYKFVTHLICRSVMFSQQAIMLALCKALVKINSSAWREASDSTDL